MVGRSELPDATLDEIYSTIQRSPRAEWPKLVERYAASDPAVAATLSALLGLTPAGPDPERVAHFRILSRLGRGGMGVVYKAEDEKLRRIVALKTQWDDADSPERRRRFLREARSAAAISHMNVAAVYEVDEAEGGAYIAMELVEGETLRDRLRRGPIDVQGVRGLALQIARGLAAAHDKGIVHRDLKPENVMIASSGVVKLLDFGLAKVVDGTLAPEASKLTTHGAHLGTFEYMSPEQAMQMPVDVRSDVFSFGIVLYEMLSGERPFGGTTVGQLLVAIARDAARPSPRREGERDFSLEALIAKCLAKAPADRFGSANEIVRALAQPTPARHRRAWLIGGASLCVIATVGLAAKPHLHQASTVPAGAPTGPTAASSVATAAPMVPTGMTCQAGGPGMTDCGADGRTSCCASLAVPGGTFLRGFDGMHYPDRNHPATVSPYRLDQYEVTVGRFRDFVDTVIGTDAASTGWLPERRSGRHTHVNGGNGLRTSDDGPDTFEYGWSEAWNDYLTSSRSEWNDNLTGHGKRPSGQCHGLLNEGFKKATWTPERDFNEKLPVNCVTWYEAYAFCIWDGGFLPSEAEWEFAAAGGSEQRAFPWSVPPTSIAMDSSYANWGEKPGRPPRGVGSFSPKGDGRWGQSDLAGNVWEWTLDAYDDEYPGTNCADCTSVPGAAGPRVIHGGSFYTERKDLFVSARQPIGAGLRYFDIGVRCARSP
jgi:formylglycine-generating enzyme required for sulfatase activity/tRNA A-37 threonylcarbamoyl transferase component Bud32